MTIYRLFKIPVKDISSEVFLGNFRISRDRGVIKKFDRERIRWVCVEPSSGHTKIVFRSLLDYVIEIGLNAVTYKVSYVCYHEIPKPSEGPEQETMACLFNGADLTPDLTLNEVLRRVRE